MNCFILKAISIDGEWFEFSLSDVPTPIREGIFVLLQRPNSPMLLLNSIRRGDNQTGLFEGDVVEWFSSKYLICYERGFYAIDENYIAKNLEDVTDGKVIGDIDKISLDIPISFKKTLLFKYRNTIFKINDIVGGTQTGILINSLAEEIPFDKIQQDSCMTVDKNRCYIGDVINGNKLVLDYGKLIWEPVSGALQSK